MIKNKQRNEAIKRLGIMKSKGLKFYKQALDTFKKGDVPIFENQGTPFRSVFFYLYGNKGQDPYDKIIKLKEQFEKEYNTMVYMVLITHTKEIGTCYDMLYISKNEEEWDMDNEDLEYNQVVSYCCSGVCNEIGTIEFAYDNVGGGIYRTR